jgi:voltage-gated potassium channel Kch
MGRQDHLIVCGFGRSGQNLVRLMEREDIAYVALDSDPQRVREAAADGSSVVYGDASRREALVSAGLAKARALAITFADTPTALRILHHVQTLRPDLAVIVRTRDDGEIDALIAAGATEVVPEVMEGSLMLASHSLLLLGVPLNRVLANIRAIREERYSLFRGFFHGATDVAASDDDQPRLAHPCCCRSALTRPGATLAELELDSGVEGHRRAAARWPLGASVACLALRAGGRGRAARAPHRHRARRAAAAGRLKGTIRWFPVLEARALDRACGRRRFEVSDRDRHLLAPGSCSATTGAARC